MLFGHGDDQYQYGKKIIADFSSNVWYEGPSQGLLTEIKNHLPDILHYPEPTGEGLKAKIASRFRLKPSNIALSNGSAEAFYLLASAYADSSSAIICPAFAEYEDACSLYDHQLSFLNHQDPWYKHLHKNKLVWMGNPNNPDGITYSKEQVKNLLDNYPETLFIIDEAYAELCDSFENAVPLISNYPNLVIIRSFTKTFAIPGLRIGYILAAEHIQDIIQQWLIPWTVNTLALVAGHYILDHYDDLKPDHNQIKQLSSMLQQQVAQFNKIQVFPSNCNFFLARLQEGSATELKRFLLNNHGLLIRDASNFRGLDEKYFRIAVQHPDYNELLTEGLKDWL